MKVDDSVIGGVGSVRDVREAVEARRALALSEEHYRMLADHVADVVLQLTPTLEILWVSPSVRVVLGWRPEELLGARIDDFVHPDDWPRLHPMGQRLIDRTQQVGPLAPPLLRVRRSDDTYCWIAARPAPVLDGQARLTSIVTAWTDVSELVSAREAAQDAALRLRATLDCLFDPHVVMRAVRDDRGAVVNFVYVEVNEAACAVHGRLHEELIGAYLLDLEPGDAGRLVLDQNAEVVDTGVPLVLTDFPYPAGTADARERRFDVRSVKVGDLVSNTWRDVTDRHVFEEGLSHRATHDPLTGLANRVALVDELSRALVTYRRSNRPVGVIMLDLDHFKTVNDTVGHAVGDQLLKSVARRLESTVRGGDLVSRLGGDEFVVVMREIVDPKEAFQAGIRIVEALRRPIVAGGLEMRTTASVGIVIATPDSVTEVLLGEADAAMYRAKAEGRDRVSIFNDDLRVAAVARSEMEGQLRPALSLGELTVHYQPEIDLLTGRVCAVEALLRWHHPSGELYPAARFIDLAEEIGIIVDTGNWAVQQACLQASMWAARRPGDRVRLRLNLSMRQVCDPSIVGAFDIAIADSGIDPALVCVEIREEVLLRATSIAHSNLTELHQRGIGLAIDNFGTGYGALSSLRDHQVDTVKIDRSLIHDITTNSFSGRLLGGLVAFAQRLDVRVSVEGVETQDQIDLLRDLGCTSAQGWVFSAPVPADLLPLLFERRFLV